MPNIYTSEHDFYPANEFGMMLLGQEIYLDVGVWDHDGAPDGTEASRINATYIMSIASARRLEFLLTDMIAHYEMHEAERKAAVVQAPESDTTE